MINLIPIKVIMPSGGTARAYITPGQDLTAATHVRAQFADRPDPIPVHVSHIIRVGAS